MRGSGFLLNLCPLRNLWEMQQYFLLITDAARGNEDEGKELAGYLFLRMTLRETSFLRNFVCAACQMWP